MDDHKINGEFIHNLHQGDFSGVGKVKFGGKEYDLANSSRYEEFKKILEDFAKKNFDPKSKDATDKFLKDGGMDSSQWDKRMKLLKVLFPEQ